MSFDLTPEKLEWLRTYVPPDTSKMTPIIEEFSCETTEDDEKWRLFSDGDLIAIVFLAKTEFGWQVYNSISDYGSSYQIYQLFNEILKEHPFILSNSTQRAQERRYWFDLMLYPYDLIFSMYDLETNEQTLIIGDEESREINVDPWDQKFTTVIKVEKAI